MTKVEGLCSAEGCFSTVEEAEEAEEAEEDSMTVREIILQLCTEAGMKLSELAESAEISLSNLSHRIAEPDEGMNMRVSSLLKLLDVMGAQLLVQSENEEEYLVEGDA